MYTSTYMKHIYITNKKAKLFFITIIIGFYSITFQQNNKQCIILNNYARYHIYLNIHIECIKIIVSTISFILR